MKTPKGNRRVYRCFGTVAGVAALVMLAWPSSVPAQSVESTLDVTKPAQPEPAPRPSVQACADPSAGIALTHVLSGTKLNVSLSGRVCNTGKRDYSVPPKAALHAAYYLDTRYPPAAYGQPASLSEKIHDVALPTLRAGQCIDVPKSHVLEWVVQMGVNPNLRDTQQVAKRYRLRVEANGVTPPKSADNCAVINDAGISSEIVYMELWKFSK